MAKQQNGPQREELKAKTAPNARRVIEAVLGVSSEEPANAPPENSAQSTVEAAADKGDSVVSEGGVKFTPTPSQAGATLSKQEVDLLARKFENKPKDTTMPLDDTIAEVKARNEELRNQKSGRVQQGSRIIKELRRNDSEGKKTCSFCGQRVLIGTMDSKKELCEVCAS